jgi:prepilin-type N-terminal cleavage/methylation domain-containing protein
VTRALRSLRARCLAGSREDQRGMTLIELIVSSLLLAVVGTLVGTILIRIMWTQRNVTETGISTTSAQTTFSGIELAVRNASEVYAVAIGDDVLLLSKTRSTSAASPTAGRCSGWYFDAATGEVRSATDDASGTTRTQSAKITPALGKTWPRIMSRVSKTDASTPVFNYDSVKRTVTISMVVDTTPQSRPVKLQSSVAQRSQLGSIGGVACF